MRHPLCLLVVYHQKDEIEISGDEWGKKARLLYTLKGLNIRRLKIFFKKKKVWRRRPPWLAFGLVQCLHMYPWC